MVNKLVDLSLGTRDLRALKSYMQRLLPGCHGLIAPLPRWPVSTTSRTPWEIT